MKKITLFLDIDGVIATPKQWGLSQGSKLRLKEFKNVYPFDPGCVKILNEITSQYPNIEMVIHSDWIFHFSYQEMVNICSQNGLLLLPTALTVQSRSRSGRIQEYINKHNIQNYFILDDMDMKSSFGDRFIIIPKENEGLKQSGLKEKILSFLQNNFESTE